MAKKAYSRNTYYNEEYKIHNFMENTMEEIWKPIDGFEAYQVSSLGKVRSKDRYANSGIGIRLYKGKVLKLGMDRVGYLHVVLSKDNKQTTFSVHRLVYTSFHGKIPEGMQVNHIDEDKSNNRLENLNLMTPKENTNWGTGIERSSKSKLNRKDCSKAILQFDLQGNLIAEYPSVCEAYRTLGINNKNICAVLKGKRGTAGGFKWKYKD